MSISWTFSGRLDYNPTACFWDYKDYYSNNKVTIGMNTRKENLEWFEKLLNPVITYKQHKIQYGFTNKTSWGEMLDYGNGITDSDRIRIYFSLDVNAGKYPLYRYVMLYLWMNVFRMFSDEEGYNNHPFNNEFSVWKNLEERNNVYSQSRFELNAPYNLNTNHILSQFGIKEDAIKALADIDISKRLFDKEELAIKVKGVGNFSAFNKSVQDIYIGSRLSQSNLFKYIEENL